jgi:hypothetical protein
MQQRTLKSVLSPRVQRHGGGLVTADLSGANLDPFIMVSLYDMAAPTFPPHPHAGFSVATYILPESRIGFFNQDTLGNKNRIAPGALHVTVAGAGVLHEEQPERLGSLARGYQIWIDHSEAQRELAPHALSLAAPDVPLLQRNGAEIRVVLGASNGAVSPLNLPTPVRLVDVTLTSGARFEQNLAHGETAFLLALDGALEVAGAEVRAGDMALTAVDGDLLTLTARSEPARFTLFAGVPLQSPRVQAGPFVASSEAQLQRFAANFRAGRFGMLTPIAAQPDWAADA